MSAPDNRTYLGFDPGGRSSFGAAILRGTRLETACVSSAAEAISWVVDKCRATTPTAAGLDTLLHWSDGIGGWRPADRHLRACGLTNTLAPNSLRGAMVLGGIVLAHRSREEWPKIRLNETHPKALARARNCPPFGKRGRKSWNWLGQTAGVDQPRDSNEHIFDAVISAWATREAAARSWPNIVGDEGALFFPIERIEYRWPG